MSEKAGAFALTAHTMQDYDTISWENEGVRYAFQYVSDTWNTLDEPVWPVRQDVIREMAEKIIGLEATRKLENVKSLGDYGLETPAFSVAVSWKDGTSAVYAMGDATPFADGYYLNLSGQDGTVYTIASSLAASFNITQKDMAAMEDIPSVANAVRLTVGNRLDAVKEAESKTVNPEQFWYDAVSGEPLDASQTEALASSASGIAWDELTAAAASEEELAGWKLDEASALKLTLMGDDGSSRILLIGAQNDSGDYYVRLPGSAMVYTVTSGAMGSLPSASADTLRVTSILPLSYDDLASADFTAEKGSCHLEKGGAETGTDAEASARESLWSQVTALKAANQPETEASDDQVLSVHAVSANGMETTVVFSEYSAEYYQAAVDGRAPVLVSAETIDAIIRTVRSMRP